MGFNECGYMKAYFTSYCKYNHKKIMRAHTCTQSDYSSLRVLSWAHSSASYLSPSSPVLPLFPGCTPTCPGLASREFSLAGGMFSELRFSSPSLFFFVFPGFFHLYRYWLITGTFSCQQCTAAAVEHLLTSHLLLLPAHFLISGSEEREEVEGRAWVQMCINEAVKGRGWLREGARGARNDLHAETTGFTTSALLSSPSTPSLSLSLLLHPLPFIPHSLTFYLSLTLSLLACLLCSPACCHYWFE